MFFTAGIPQILVPLWGFILDKVRRPQLTLAGSLFLIAFSTFFLGPLSFSPIKK